MEVLYNKKFLKDLSKIPKKFRKNLEVLVFNELPQKQCLEQISNIKKIQGSGTFYRIRLGDYRIGLELKSEQNKHNGLGIETYQLILRRVLHRKEIYRFFP